MRKLLRKWSRFVVFAALLLSGCFRPAGDSIQPTSGSNIQAVNTTVPTATNGFPPITLLAPNGTEETSASTETGFSGPLPVLTEVTVIPFEETASPTPPPLEGSVTATLQIITPGISLDLVTPDTPTPLPPDQGTEDIGLVTEEPTLPLAAQVTQETLASGAPCTVTVQPGDSLYAIALRNKTSVNAMKSANADLSGDAPILQPGQVLKLPNCTPGATPTQAETIVGIDSNVPIPGQDTYVVSPGDTLGAIASRYNVSVSAIMQANNLSNPNQLSIGQKLIIPIKQAQQ